MEQQIEYHESLLKNWMLLNEKVMDLTEEDLLKLQELEQEGRARLRVMLRIYNRYSKIRSIREKLDIAKAAKG